MPNSQTESYLSPPKGPRFSIFNLNQSARALALLIALFLQIILEPLDHYFPIISLLIQLGVIFSAIIMVADTRLHLTIGLALGIPASLFLIFGRKQGIDTMTWVGFSCVLVLYIHVIRLALMRVFKAVVVTMETIILAMCAYVLLGSLWTLFYIPLAALDQGAFMFNVMREGTPIHDSLYYFSFVTLTTLGYGDIVPVSPLARSLAVTEALTGVLFLAVLISRLVGSYKSSPRSD
jgi:voltage-gated potassium channel Kch